ncbi:DUF1018 domain-containing protein [Rhizobium sp. CRIBSB]|nr:DUF1018 domain-containing protein [Rhizobium sp. CRIBSB]
MTRRAAVMKVQIARKELGLDEDTYRAILQRLTGQTSSAACSDAELGRVLDEFKTKGWTPRVVAGGKTGAARPRRAVQPADHPSAKKARALWLSLWNLGEVRDPSEAALEAFARRQLKVERLQWADQSQTYKLIEALKAMAERAGWSQQLDRTHAGREVEVLKRRLLLEQVRRLRTGPLSKDQLAFLREVVFQGGDLDAAIADYGRQLRARSGAAG